MSTEHTQTQHLGTTTGAVSRQIVVLALLFAVAMGNHGLVLAQKSEPSMAEWRRSDAKFADEVNAYIKSGKNFPSASFDFVHKGGEVPKTWEIMSVYTGKVEWQGVFIGFEKGTHVLESRTHKVKVEDTDVLLHLYPSASSIASWQALSPNARVRFTGTIEGIAGKAFGFGKRPVTVYVSLKDVALVNAK